ncbi:MAG: hypothetical protein ACFHWX_01865 [Bacteroidota bacterium]
MRSILFIFFLICSIQAFPNNTNKALRSKIISLSITWEEESKKLVQYKGLSGFCNDLEFRTSYYDLLKEIHQYHGLLYEQLIRTSDQHDQKKMNKVLEELEFIEKDYNIISFNDFFRERCYDQQDMEKNTRQHKSGFGVHSYHGKIYVMEEELRRYIEKLTKRITLVKKHIRHLHLEANTSIMIE